MRDMPYLVTLLHLCFSTRSFINELRQHHTSQYNTFRSLSTSYDHFVSLAVVSTNISQAFVYCSFHNGMAGNWDESTYSIDHSPYNTQIRTAQSNQNINNSIFVLFNTTSVFLSSIAQP